MKTMSMLSEKNKFFEKDFFVFDTETRGLRGKSDAFIFGVIYGYNYQRVIYSVQEFQQEFLKPQYKKKKVFAHNAEYDLNVIYDNIYKLDSKAIFNGKFICCTNGNCVFADSLNIFPTSVKEIGKLIGLEKKEIDNKFVEGKKEIKVTKKDIEYCLRDCEIIYNALLKMFDKVGNVKITIAGLSLDLFRRHYQKFHIDYNDDLEKEFFLSYFGGRCEAFKIGNVSAVVYDINSMYPKAMVECIFPNPKYLKCIVDIDVKVFISKYLKNYEGCATIEVEHSNYFIGTLPYKKKIKGSIKLLFPIGKFSGVWNFNEIRFALENNFIKIKKVSKIVYSQRMLSPFKEYIISLYNERINTNDDFEKFQLKLFMNTLYGKFAQKITKEFIYIENIETQYEDLMILKKSNKHFVLKLFNSERMDAFIEIDSQISKYTYNTIPSFSSYITSWARILILKKLIEFKDFNPVYCDTDSIFFETDPMIKDSKELGEFKKENKIITEISGLKNYSYIENEKLIKKIKGIPKTAKKINDKTYKYNSLLKTKEALRRNKDSGILIQRIKELTLNYDKRIVLKNGNTKPIIIIK